MIKLKEIMKEISDKEIKKSLQHRRKTGGCGMLRYVGIPHLVKIGKWNDLYEWEKKWFLDGVVKGLWDKKGNHLKDRSKFKDEKIQIKEYLILRKKGLGKD